MPKKIVVVNAGPRKGWNTDTLLMEAAKGAEASGVEIVKFDLFKLEKYTGYISCFGCKREKFKGHCICRDGLTPVLFIMTSNAPDTMYTGLVENYKNTLTRFVGPAETFVSGNTLQLKDYSKTDWPWTMFNPDDKIQRHETVFPEECKKVFEMGKRIFQ